MLIKFDLNINLWGAAEIAPNYLINLSPSSALNRKSSHEAMLKILLLGSGAYPLELKKLIG